MGGPRLLEARPRRRHQAAPRVAFRHGRIAQLVEQLTLNQRVLGSSPSASTTLFSGQVAHRYTVQVSIQAALALDDGYLAVGTNVSRLGIAALFRADSNR
jgi:hypothetical protein